MQAFFAGVIHQVAQIEQQRFTQILDSFFVQPVLQRKERMTGKTQRTIEAALTHKREHIYHAAMLDPHTAAELSIPDIIALCDEMIESNAGWIGEYR